MALTAALRRLDRLVFPPICPACRQLPVSAEESNTRFCPDCSRQLAPMPSPRCNACGGIIDGILDICGECAANPQRSWDHAVSVYAYGGYVRRLIHRFKYRGATALAPAFAAAMSANYKQHGQGLPNIVAPIPMHWFRRLFRGYNQADILARLVGRNLGVPVARPLKRVRCRARQASLDLETRRRNVHNVFSAKRKTNLQGYRIVLIDDVLTTGATLNAATAALKEAGAAYIEILTLARG